MRAPRGGEGQARGRGIICDDCASVFLQRFLALLRVSELDGSIVSKLGHARWKIVMQRKRVSHSRAEALESPTPCLAKSPRHPRIRL